MSSEERAKLLWQLATSALLNESADKMLSFADKLRYLAARQEARDETTLALWDLKHDLLSVLNDVDRALYYGRPGAGFDDRFGDRPINLRECS